VKILSISESSFVVGHLRYVGFVIETSSGCIGVGIQEGRKCCESYGYLSSLDNFDDFIDSQVLSVSVVDSALNLTTLKLKEVQADNCIFVNIETTKGLFQITVYNEHNGYYAHDVYVSNCDAILVNRYL
jgi:hypothetical protein